MDWKKRESGFVTLLVMILLVSLAGSGLQTYTKANVSNRIARREAQSRQAVYLAEGGIEWVKGELLVNPGWTGGVIPVGSGHVRITVTNNDGKYQVIAIAQAGFAVRKLQVSLLYDAGRWVMSGYHEVHT